MARTTGTVRWFNDAKGYGFIATDGDHSRDVFVHHSAIDSDGFRSLAENDHVEFDIEDAPKGPSAKHVTKIAAS
jgi:CspA family cold shock protein